MPLDPKLRPALLTLETLDASKTALVTQALTLIAVIESGRLDPKYEREVRNRLDDLLDNELGLIPD